MWGKLARRDRASGEILTCLTPLMGADTGRFPHALPLGDVFLDRHVVGDAAVWTS